MASNIPATDECTVTPRAATCMTDASALFVSRPKGSQTGEGSRANPVESIKTALGKIDAARRRIYVCEGAYPEDVAFDASHNGVSVIGGVDCDWNAKADAKPVLGASANPMKAVGTMGLALVDVAVEAKDAASGSSIALFIAGGDVTLKGVRLVAGKGAAGEPGKLVPYGYPDVALLKGNDATAGGGGEEKTFTCPGGAVTKGGKGGNLGTVGAPGEPALGGGAGGTLGACEVGTGGGNGAAGTPGIAGTGAQETGSLSSAAWLPSRGGDGAHGGPGQGGGGGGGSNGNGGGGGAGGCGGAGGPGGSGGGASVALAIVDAKVDLAASMLQSKDGGAGGSGAKGQDGQTTFGFKGNASGGACSGGNGGPGGNGAPGGGGAGGISVGVLYKGTKPELDAATQTAIQVGTAGAGGKDGLGGNANAGIPGVSEPIFASP